MDGVLVVDKPAGLTSHDVVQTARRALGEPRIGHTGTLDPLATGVLALVCGRATRLVRFFAADDKEYEATVRFGVTTDSYDVTGSEVARTDRQPDRATLEQTLHTFVGEHLQTPPPFSAKKVEGRRAYARARAGEAVSLAPVAVSVASAALLDLTGTAARIRLRCSAGFYVRALAHAWGQLVGTGACLEALRRTRSGQFGLESAITMDTLVSGADAAGPGIVPLERLLPGFPACRLTDDLRRRVVRGQDVESDLEGSAAGWVRLIDADGHLVALATRAARPGFLHPAVVLT
jgi:tRNA pseudouridine55 synthase